jgi:hypothetical protein
MVDMDTPLDAIEEDKVFTWLPILVTVDGSTESWDDNGAKDSKPDRSGSRGLSAPKLATDACKDDIVAWLDVSRDCIALTADCRDVTAADVDVLDDCSDATELPSDAVDDCKDDTKPPNDVIEASDEVKDVPKDAVDVWSEPRDDCIVVISL